MVEQQVKNSIVCDLLIGWIQPFQVEEQLRKKGVSSFEIERMQTEILEKYHRMRPRR